MCEKKALCHQLERKSLSLRYLYYGKTELYLVMAVVWGRGNAIRVTVIRTSVWKNLEKSMIRFISFSFGGPARSGGFPSGSAGKESACIVGDLGSIPGLGRPPGEGNSYPLQYSDLENSMDCIVHGVTKSRIRQSDFHFRFPLEVLLDLHVHIQILNQQGVHKPP